RHVDLLRGALVLRRRRPAADQPGSRSADGLRDLALVRAGLGHLPARDAQLADLRLGRRRPLCGDRDLLRAGELALRPRRRMSIDSQIAPTAVKAPSRFELL